MAVLVTLAPLGQPVRPASAFSRRDKARHDQQTPRRLSSPPPSQKRRPWNECMRQDAKRAESICCFVCDHRMGRRSSRQHAGTQQHRLPEPTADDALCAYMMISHLVRPCEAGGEADTRFRHPTSDTRHRHPTRHPTQRVVHGPRKHLECSSASPSVCCDTGNELELQRRRTRSRPPSSRNNTSRNASTYSGHLVCSLQPHGRVSRLKYTSYLCARHITAAE